MSQNKSLETNLNIPIYHSFPGRLLLFMLLIVNAVVSNLAQSALNQSTNDLHRILLRRINPPIFFPRRTSGGSATFILRYEAT